MVVANIYRAKQQQMIHVMRTGYAVAKQSLKLAWNTVLQKYRGLIAGDLSLTAHHPWIPIFGQVCLTRALAGVSILMAMS